MIQIKNLDKRFGKNKVLDNLDLVINDGDVFGLVGINGSGKSTLLRTISGVYEADSGTIEYDGINVFENPNVKKDIFFLSDNPYYPNNSSINTILDFYKSFYDVDVDRFNRIVNKFKLNFNKPINNFSKGMKRQLFIALAISICPKYLFLDEAFDGLDPLARLIFKRELLDLIEEKQITVVISSHSLRELEDICDKYGLLDQGRIDNKGSINESKANYHKYQLAFEKEIDKDAFKGIDVVSFNKVGRIIRIVTKGNEEEISSKLKALNPILIDKVEIDFEELFIIEVEGKGYLNE